MALQPILKWAGGKDKELKYILPAAPVDFENYYEPFVGGGSVFMAATARRYFVNDFSDELAGLYRSIAGQDRHFYRFAESIDRAWSAADDFFFAHPELTGLYRSYRDGNITKDELVGMISDFCRDNSRELLEAFDRELVVDGDFAVNELEKNLKRKMLRMHELEIKKQLLPDADILDNIHTAVKSAFYMYFRRLYNDRELAVRIPGVHTALFLFIRNYAYGGMFRYNDAGDFNVPYGGIAYNSKSMKKKLRYYRSEDVLARFAETEVSNMDFEAFLRHHNPAPEDFVFLDPPYDSEFSTYVNNEFTRDDHRRLADYLINECRARWMLVIKSTDFIFGLYNQPGINIRMFDKEYLVSFMNRNDRRAVHLLITNY